MAPDILHSKIKSVFSVVLQPHVKFCNLLDRLLTPAPCLNVIVYFLSHEEGQSRTSAPSGLYKQLSNFKNRAAKPRVAKNWRWLIPFMFVRSLVFVTKSVRRRALFGGKGAASAICMHHNVLLIY